MPRTESKQRCLPSCENARAPLRGPPRRSAQAGQPRRLPRDFTDARRHRLDSTSRCSRSASAEPNALDTTSAGGCLYEHDYGSPKHPEPRKTAVPWTTALIRPKVAFLPKRSPELLVARGRVYRYPTLLLAVARAEDFAPTPIAPSTSCRERHFFAPPGAAR